MPGIDQLESKAARTTFAKADHVHEQMKQVLKEEDANDA
jgi:hypothetical protein